MEVSEFTSQLMQLQAGLKRVMAQCLNYIFKAWPQFRMFFEEFAGLAQEMLSRFQRIHLSIFFCIDGFQELGGILEFAHSPCFHILQRGTDTGYVRLVLSG